MVGMQRVGTAEMSAVDIGTVELGSLEISTAEPNTVETSGVEMNTVDIDERMFSGGPMIRGHVEVITTVESRRSIRVWCDCELGEDHDFRRPSAR